MDDKELLELAALPAGAKRAPKGVSYSRFGSATPIVTSVWKLNNEMWVPLEDDGDALRLAVNLDMQITVNRVDGFVEVIAGYHGQHRIRESLAGCLYTATRRATVRAAAEIGRAMK